jgi:hypothetical protein
MARDEIRISVFYSDQSVYDFMHQAAGAGGSSNRITQLVKDANDFYGRFRLRIDPFPFPYDEKLYKSAFVLRASNGIKADPARAQLTRDMKQTDDRRTALVAELTGGKAKPDRVKQIKSELEAMNPLYQDFLWRADDFVSSSEYDFRLDLDAKFKTDKSLIANSKAFAKNPRLAVVFSEYTPPDKSSPMYRPLEDLYDGIFIQPLNAAKRLRCSKFKKQIPGYDLSFVSIDCKSADWYTLAHEIAHGNGHSHPTSGMLGFGDGPNNSIYNYSARGLAPSKVILEDKDQKTLKLAYFVR